MLKFSANISTLFTEVEFLERFEASSNAGFKAVECHYPYEWEPDQIGAKLSQFDLKLVLHNVPVGNRTAGEKGIALIPDRVGEFQESIALAMRYAKTLQCPCVNCPVGLTPDGLAEDLIRETLRNNLRFAAAALEKENIRLVVEALNSRDVPGFYLATTAQAIDVIDEVNHANLYLQYDIYHMQIMEGNLTETIRTNISRIRHIQLADNPGRNEPGTGEINFKNLLRFIDEANYDGWIGCEYTPRGRTEDSLGWLAPYLQ